MFTHCIFFDPSLALEADVRRKEKGNSVPYGVNWGHPGDELLDVPIDEFDPSYDSSEEIFEKAYAAHKKSSITIEVDWADLVKEAEILNDDDFQSPSTSKQLANSDCYDDSIFFQASISHLVYF